jgi:hypothetical protein
MSPANSPEESTGAGASVGVTEDLGANVGAGVGSSVGVRPGTDVEVGIGSKVGVGRIVNVSSSFPAKGHMLVKNAPRKAAITAIIKDATVLLSLEQGTKHIPPVSDKPVSHQAYGGAVWLP